MPRLPSRRSSTGTCGDTTTAPSATGPAGSESLWEGGYLHTGDVATIDPIGYVQICDRVKDMVKSGGEWISSLELEDLIGRHPAVGEVAVIGMPDPKWGERPLALVVLRDGWTGRVGEGEIRSHVQGFADRGAISGYGVPEEVRFVPSLEKTSVGKLDKQALRRKYL